MNVSPVSLISEDAPTVNPTILTGQKKVKPCRSKEPKVRLNHLFDQAIITETGCWEFQGHRCQGYGMARVFGKLKRVHAHVYELINGPVAPKMEVCHTCDNPSCINPEHLFMGTHLENMQDMAKRGRQNHFRKLSQNQIEHIFELIKKNITYADIAKVFNVNSSHIALLAIKKGIRRRPFFKRNLNISIDVLMLIKKNIDYHEIAKHLNTQYTYVCNVAVRNGIRKYKSRIKETSSGIL